MIEVYSEEAGDYLGLLKTRAKGIAMRLWTLLCLALLSLPGLSGVQAAELTDVIDAADGDDLYDFVGEVFYRRSLRRAKITREYNCNPDPKERPYDLETCPTAGPEGELLEVKELRYQRTIHEIVPRFRFGIWHDLELWIEAPIVISSDQELRFAGNGGDSTKPIVDEENSSIAPGAQGSNSDPENLFDVPTNLPSRAGFGDMLFMLRFAPIAQERYNQPEDHDTRGDWMLELGYRAPTGTVAKFGNEGVGRGVNELIIGTALSRRFRYIDPYMHLQGIFVFPAGSGLFDDYGASQDEVGPGHRAHFEFGSEIIPYRDPKRKIRFFIDLRLASTYHAEGRDYSELFDAFASAQKTCNPNGHEGAERCPTYTKESKLSLGGQFTDGITTVEEYMTVGARVGVGIYLSQYLKLGVELGLDHDTEHFITKAEIGKDLDGSGLVEAQGDPKYNAEEQNPIYVPAYDAIGSRIRVEETTLFSVKAGLSGHF